jgi:hypothetical protein
MIGTVLCLTGLSLVIAGLANDNMETMFYAMVAVDLVFMLDFFGVKL